MRYNYSKFTFVVAVMTGLAAVGCSSSGHMNGNVSRTSSNASMMARTQETPKPVKVNHRGQGQSSSFAAGGPGNQGQSSNTLRADGEASMVLHEEELVVGKKTVGNGGVSIRRIVETRQVDKPVELLREEYVIERIPAGELGSAGPGAEIFVGNEIFIPLYKEIPVIDKQARVVEWVQVDKITETDRRMVSHELRKENIEIARREGPADAERFAGIPADNARGMGAAGETGQSTQTLNGGGATSAADRGDSSRISLNEEELLVGKRKVDNGGVVLTKTVATRIAEQPVDLKREEYRITRSAGAGDASSSDAFQEKEINITLEREEPVVGTRTLAVERVMLRKERETDQRMISDTVRRERLEVEEK